MPKNKKRTNTKNLPKPKQELTPDHSKRVKGGVATILTQQKVADGSVRFITDGTSNTILKQAKK